MASEAAQADLTGELPPKVHLECEGRQYRIWFTKGIWDTKSVGAWSGYYKVANVEPDKIVLSDGIETFPGIVEPYFLELERAGLKLVERRGVPTHVYFPLPPEEPQPKQFACQIREATT
ncbi:hypothetical protein [uncultured Erythrobacter sp.]|uniref:hypothetical protein n=1 Tax=uncultured Erythrobacter sp. TaxID=263913 RepID=UPI00263683AC|nr:hypothetical protein [uncultured Erythrobacter sp.]